MWPASKAQSELSFCRRLEPGLITSRTNSMVGRDATACAISCRMPHIGSLTQIYARWRSHGD